MKDLLNDIVVKMSNTLVDNKSLNEENSILYDDRHSPHGGASVSICLFFLNQIKMIISKHLSSIYLERIVLRQSRWNNGPIQ